jgi:hypothetical protein
MVVVRMGMRLIKRWLRVGCVDRLVPNWVMSESVGADFMVPYVPHMRIHMPMNIHVAMSFHMMVRMHWIKYW